MKLTFIYTTIDEAWTVLLQPTKKQFLQQIQMLMLEKL